MKSIVWIFFILIFSAASVSADSVYLYHRHWSQVSSDHFIAVYPTSFSNQAKDFILEAENAHSLLSPGFPLTTRRRTWLVLSDAVDDPNGSAMAFPIKVINAYLQHPASADEFNNIRNWPRLLMLHEYTHILQLDQTRGILVPWHFSMNNLLPVWMIEGLAVWDESAYTEEGRGHSAWVDMYFRTDCLDRFTMGIDRLTTFPDVWPFGSVPYVYGRQFYEWLATRFGETKIKELSVRNPYRVPYFQAGLARGVFGRTLPDLYREFQRDEADLFDDQLRSIRGEHVTPLRAVFPKKGRTECLSADGSKLYFFNKDEDHSGRIVEVDPSTGRLRTVRNELPIKGLAVTGERIFFAREVTIEDTAESYDLWSCRLDGGGLKRLTRKEHVSMPFTVGSENAVYYISRIGPSATVVKRLDLKTRVSSVVYTPPGDLVLLEAVGTADHYYFIARREKGVQDIYSCGRANGFLTRLTSNGLLECGLSVDQAGRRLLFSADVKGVYDAFALDLSSLKDGPVTVERLSRVLTGFFSPVALSGGVWGLEYGRNGFGVSGLESPLRETVEWPVEADRPACDLGPLYPVSNPGRYDGLLPFIKSTLILPYLVTDLIGDPYNFSFPLIRYGVSINCSDLFQGTMFSFILFAGQSELYDEPLQYESRFRAPLTPWLALRIEHRYSVMKFGPIEAYDSWGNSTGFVTSTSRSLLADAGFEFTSSRRSFSAIVIPWVSLALPLQKVPVLYVMGGATIGLSDLKTTRRSFVPERGWAVSGELVVTGGHIVRIAPTRLNFSCYLPLGKSSVLSLRNFVDFGSEIIGHELGFHLPLSGIDRGSSQTPVFYRTFGLEFTARDIVFAGDWPAGSWSVGPGIALAVNLGYWAPVTFHASVLIGEGGALQLTASVDTPLDSQYHPIHLRNLF